MQTLPSIDPLFPVAPPLLFLLLLHHSPVNPHPEPQWSGAHKGLALYVSRLLTPVWDVKVITPSRTNANVWKARLTEQTMMVRRGGVWVCVGGYREADTAEGARGACLTGGCRREEESTSGQLCMQSGQRTGEQSLTRKGSGAVHAWGGLIKVGHQSIRRT